MTGQRAQRCATAGGPAIAQLSKMSPQRRIGFMMIAFAIVIGFIKLRCAMGDNNLGAALVAYSREIRSLGVVVSLLQLVAGFAWVFGKQAIATRWTLAYAIFAMVHTIIVLFLSVPLPNATATPSTCTEGVGCIVVNWGESFGNSMRALDALGKALILLAGVCSVIWPLFLVRCRDSWCSDIPVAFAKQKVL